MKKLLFTAGVIILFVATGARAQEGRFEVPIGDSPSRGPANAPVTIIEFIDFQ